MQYFTLIRELIPDNMKSPKESWMTAAKTQWKAVKKLTHSKVI